MGVTISRHLGDSAYGSEKHAGCAMVPQTACLDSLCWKCESLWRTRCSGCAAQKTAELGNLSDLRGASKGGLDPNGGPFRVFILQTTFTWADFCARMLHFPA